jgi:hypothetical protein
MTDYKIPDFPEVFDNSIRSAFANCQRKGYWEFIRNLRKPGGDINLAFGGCFARAIEVARKSFYMHGVSSKTAELEGIIAATEMWETEDGDQLVPHKGNSANKTYAALVDAIDSYFKRWSLDHDEVRPLELPNGELFIEKSFAFPIEGTSHPTTGKPIIYAGRLDMLGKWKDTNLNIGIDEKTSTQLGENWSNGWNTRAQFTGYCIGSEVYGFKIRHFHIRGIGILKSDITFAEDIQRRQDWQIDQWQREIQNDINRAIHTYKLMCLEPELGLHTPWSMNLDQMCTAYGRKCSYMDLCTSEHPERWLGNYDEVIWNPLASRD